MTDEQRLTHLLQIHNLDPNHFLKSYIDIYELTKETLKLLDQLYPEIMKKHPNLSPTES